MWVITTISVMMNIFFIIYIIQSRRRRKVTQNNIPVESGIPPNLSSISESFIGLKPKIVTPFQSRPIESGIPPNLSSISESFIGLKPKIVTPFQSRPMESGIQLNLSSIPSSMKGEVLEGYAYWAEGRKTCKHKFLKISDTEEQCLYCEATQARKR